MKKVPKINDDDLYTEMHELTKIGNQAVMKAKQENKQHGIPEFFYKNGVIYFEKENGKLTTEKPKIFQD